MVIHIVFHTEKSIKKGKIELCLSCNQAQSVKTSNMFGTINTILTKIDDLVWGVPLIVMILATGIFLTIRLKGIQVRKLIRAFKYMFSNEKD